MNRTTKPLIYFLRYLWFLLTDFNNFRRRVSMLCMQSAILLYQFRPSVCPSVCPTPVLCLNECTYGHSFKRSDAASFEFFELDLGVNRVWFCHVLTWPKISLTFLTKSDFQNPVRMSLKRQFSIIISIYSRYSLGLMSYYSMHVGQD